MLLLSKDKYILANLTLKTYTLLQKQYISNKTISRISEGSCDPEDWSNDAENSALHHRNNFF